MCNIVAQLRAQSLELRAKAVRLRRILNIAAKPQKKAKPPC